MLRTAYIQISLTTYLPLCVFWFITISMRNLSNYDIVFASFIKCLFVLVYSILSFFFVFYFSLFISVLCHFFIVFFLSFYLSFYLSIYLSFFRLFFFFSFFLCSSSSSSSASSAFLLYVVFVYCILTEILLPTCR